MGEHDLLSAAFLIDTAQYYIFVVIPSYRFFGKFQWMPVLGPRPAFFSYHMMRIYNRRFKSIGVNNAPWLKSISARPSTITPPGFNE